MDDFSELKFNVLLDRISAREPTPGGGSVAAASGALACAMGEMVASYSQPKTANLADETPARHTARKLSRAEELFRALMVEDARAYEIMTAARKSASNDSSAEQAYQEAVTAALAVPMEIAAVASSVLHSLDDFKEDTSRYLISDLGVAAVLAEATAQAAAYSVRINLAELTDKIVAEKSASEINRITKGCTTRLLAIKSYVDPRLE